MITEMMNKITRNIIIYTNGNDEGSSSALGPAGPLSMLPPNPTFSQNGGFQPYKQWQFFLLLQTPRPLHLVGKQSYFRMLESTQVLFIHTSVGLQKEPSLILPMSGILWAIMA